MTYKTLEVDTTVTVEVDLDDFTDNDIEEEFYHRGLDVANHDERLHAIYQAMRLGKKEHAYDLMWDFIRDKLGVAV